MKRKPLKIGLIADPQYANIPSRNSRYYSNSLEKLKEAVAVFEKNECDFIIGLGDLIDQAIESYNPVMEILTQSSIPFFSVLGNHDFEVADDKKPEVPSRLGLKNRYYEISKRDWLFIFMDGNDLSLYAPAPGCVNESQSLWQIVEQEGRVQAKDWNGGVSQVQLMWLNDQLRKAEKKGKKVLIFSHFPVFPTNCHNLWNDKEVLDLLEDYSCVKAFINGHNHVGEYGKWNGIHFLTLQGMVETPDKNTFAILTLNNGMIEVDGTGREEDRIMTFK